MGSRTGHWRLAKSGAALVLVASLSLALRARAALGAARMAPSSATEEQNQDPSGQTSAEAGQTPASTPVPNTPTEAPSPTSGRSPKVQKGQGGGFKITTKVDLVVLPATVVDKKGRMVNGLSRSNFQVYEDRIQQTLAVFSHADVPVTLGIVIDDSGSMKEKRPAVNAAAVAFAETSNPQDQVFVVNFNDVYYLDTPGDFASNIEDLRGALSKIDSRGGTALYDALYASIDHLHLGNRDKKVLLAITDGEDNASRYTFPELLKYAQQSNATIYTIGLLGDDENKTGHLFNMSSRGDRHAKKVLEQLAEATGGAAFFPGSLQEVDATCRQIAHDIRNQYTLGYYPTDKATDGTFRSVRVQAFEPGTRKKLVVRTKPGYYAPKPDQPSATASGS